MAGLITHAQTIVNKEWTRIAGVPDPLSVTTSCIDFQNNVITASSAIVVGQDADISVIKYDQTGSILWQNSFNGVSNGKDYATSIKTDNSGNVYVTGTTFDNTSNFDYIVLKYDINGSLQWQLIFNGTGNNLDIPSALALDNVGDIYVTGTSVGIGSLTDYATIKISNSGNLIWQTFYDYAQGYEAPVGIEIAPNGSKIFITGASASTSASTNWDFATVDYDASTGNQLGVNRVVSAGNGIDRPSAICRDNAGNIYVTGSYFNQTNNSNDIKTLKLNSNLVVQWTMTFNGDNLDDQANSIDVDASGNVFVAGTVKRSATGNDIIVMKYSPTGTLLWEREINSAGVLGDDEGNQIVVDVNGNAFVCGSIEQNGNKNFISMKIDPNGITNWQDIIDGGANGTDEATSVNVTSQGDIIVSGQTNDGTNDRNTTIRYENIVVEQTIKFSPTNSPMYINHELIAKFDKTHLNMNLIDNIGKQYGFIEEFLDQQSVTQIYQSLELSSEEKILLIKVHPEQTSNNTHIICRTGEIIESPEFFRTFRIILPNSLNESNSLDALNLLYPLVQDAQFNNIYKTCSIPNDPLFSAGQAGLIANTSYMAASINLDPAWNITTGNSDINVAVFDTGINWDHEDLGDGTWAGSKVKGGKDVLNNTSISSNSNNDVNGHGSACAGIIGALRNNNKGGAGVAGGDVSLSNNGTSLYAYKITKTGAALDFLSNSGTYLSALVDAINNDQIDVFSNSWHNPYAWGQCYNCGDPNLREAVQTSYNAQKIFCVASGNIDNNTQANTNTYPSSFKDEWVLKIGASGTNGDITNFSVWGSGVDCIAPGAKELYKTIDHNSSNTYNYSGDGTSFSCPTVAGVAALMLGNITNQISDIGTLTPEDVENVIQMNSTDLGSIGYNVETGFGRINAGNCLLGIQTPYKFKHYTVPFLFTDLTLVTSGVNVLGEGFGSVSAGNYNVEKYRVTKTNTHTLNSSETLVGFWDRDSRSSTMNQGNPMVPQLRDASIISCNNSQCTMEGYFYKIVSTYPFGQMVNVWIPYNPNTSANNKLSYTLYTNDASTLTTNNLVKEATNLQLFPNPSEENINLSFNSLKNEKATICIFNGLGQNVKKIEIDTKIGVNSLNVDISSYTNGVYFCKITGLGFEGNISFNKL